MLRDDIIRMLKDLDDPESVMDIPAYTADEIIRLLEAYLPLRVDGKPMELEGYREQCRKMMIAIVHFDDTCGTWWDKPLGTYQKLEDALTHEGKRVGVIDE